MNVKPVLFIAAAVGLAVGMMSCGNKQETSEAPAPAATAGKAVDPATAGTITGTIKLDGAPPKMKAINMAAEPNCSKQHSEPAMTQDVVPGDGGTLQNVVVYLKGDFSQYTFATPTTPVEIDQKGCMYNPHVLALMTNQPLTVVTSDPTTHNIHPVPKNNREWNVSQPPGSPPIMQSFAHEEISIPVKCNVHPWMKAYIAVVGTPYFQITGKDGSFSLANVPPGTYTVSAWHESYGSNEQSVTIGPKESKAVTITFKAAAAGD